MSCGASKMMSSMKLHGCMYVACKCGAEYCLHFNECIQCALRQRALFKKALEIIADRECKCPGTLGPCQGSSCMANRALRAEV